MATWNGVITNAGNSLLNEWVNEKTLNFDSAAAGQGTVAAAAMMAQTALVNEKQTASLLGGERVSSGIRLKLRIAAPNTAYTLNQFRVSASVDGGASAMIALFQLEQGVPIPSKTESPDFVYTFYALISCSNTGTWTVTVDTSACVTQSDMSAAITEAVKTKQDKIMVKGLLLGDGNGNTATDVIRWNFTALDHIPKVRAIIPAVGVLLTRPRCGGVVPPHEPVLRRGDDSPCGQRPPIPRHVFQRLHRAAGIADMDRCPAAQCVAGDALRIHRHLPAAGAGKMPALLLLCKTLDQCLGFVLVHRNLSFLRTV